MTVMNNFYGGSIPNGWSPRGGQTGSAYGTNGFDPSGSSTGSAVATSAGMCAAAVGVETCGSIVSQATIGRALSDSCQICPARQAGLYGMKPTLGLVSNAGIMPITCVFIITDYLTGSDLSDPATIRRVLWASLCGIWPLCSAA